MAQSEVRLQWDPDHDPTGKAIERRAIQLGLRGNMLKRYAEQEALSIDDVTDFVAQQREHAVHSFRELIVPEERPYIPAA